MKRRIVSQVAVVIGLIVVCTSMAQAGGGQGSTGGYGGFFLCRVMNGADLGLRVDIYTDELGFPNTTLNNVRIGNGVLGCTGVKVARRPSSSSDGGATITPPENEITPFTGSELKCYTVATSRQPAFPRVAGPNTWDVSDSFDPSEVVHTFNPLFLCGPANFNLQLQ